MRVSHRLLLTLLPAFFGLLTVVGLAYWGQYERQAPHLAVIAAIIALGVSVTLALRNARYLAQRIEKLAAESPGPTVTDELESIELSVEQLKAEVSTAREEGARLERSAETERRELASLLADAAGAATTAIDEVRLPLHILLENRFGDLNENQEEMLGSAQASAEEASALLRRLRLTADLERGTVELRRDPLRVDDIVRGLLPTLQTLGEHRSVRVSADLAPGLPRVLADRTYLHEALSIVLRSAVERTPDAGEVKVVAEPTQDTVRVHATHGPGALKPLDRALVGQLARAMALQVTDEGDRTIVELSLAAR